MPLVIGLWLLFFGAVGVGTFATLDDEWRDDPDHPRIERAPVAPIPEPSSVALFAIGGAVVAGGVWTMRR